MKAFVAHLAKLAEHLEVTAAAGQDAAGLEHQLVQVAVHLDVGLAQCLLHGLIATLFVYPVFLVQVHGTDRMLPAQREQHPRRIGPLVGMHNQQGDVQGVQ
ncbi:hypothetical protein D3C77_566840 [compost metagenome]